MMATLKMSMLLLKGYLSHIDVVVRVYMTKFEKHWSLFYSCIIFYSDYFVISFFCTKDVSPAVKEFNATHLPFYSMF